MTEDHRYQGALGRRLLRAVFGIYFFITLIVTVVQLYKEYRNVENNIVGELQDLVRTSQRSMANAIWDFNEEQLGSVVDGLLGTKTVTGIEVADKKDQLTVKRGLFPQNEEAVLERTTMGDGSVKISMQKPFDEKKLKQEEGTVTLIGVTIGLKYADDFGTEQDVGKIVVYSQESLVLEKFKYSFILIVINSLIKTAALWIIFLICVRKLVENPLYRLGDLTESFRADKPLDADQMADIASLSERKDELGHLSQRFGKMMEQNIESVAKINDFAENLELLVERRTTELFDKNRSLHAILESMDLGVMLVDVDGRVQPDYSRYLCEILDCENPQDFTIYDLVVANLDVGDDMRNQIRSVISMSIDQPLMTYVFNATHLPRQVLFKSSNHSKNLEIDWKPLVDENDRVEHILLVIKDVTEMVKMRRTAELTAEEARMTDQILNVHISEVDYFLKTSESFLGSALELVNATDEHNVDEMVQKVFILLHTIKGNARLLRFSFLVDVIHAAEDYFSDLRAHPEQWRSGRAYELFDRITNWLDRYQDVLKERILKFAADSTHNTLVSKVREEVASVMNEPHQIIQNIRSIVDDSGFKSIDSLLKEVMKSTFDVCKELGKPSPRFRITGEHSLRMEYAGLVREVLSHCIRNSITHGIEPMEERLSVGKPPQSTITVNSFIAAGKFTIHTFDDGRGLNMKKLRTIGTQKGLIAADADDQQVADLIFQSGISTAEDVSDLAGRGVGMDAVKKFVQDAGGEVSIILQEDGVVGDFCLFRMEVTLDRSVVLEQNQAA